ncbi:MAG TPA: DUF2071 domain-containing protein [Bacillales bacterium]|nr:DUF2071 domain-containing protein [Bacillales bacterium]
MDSNHRPWPAPSKPWLMKQTWRHLLFAHWPVSPDVIRPYIPKSLELDTYEGKAWVGYIFLQVRGMRPRYLPPVPMMSSFPELNVRTYVTYGGKPGVYFISLDAASFPGVQGAKLFFHLPYAYARVSLSGGDRQFECDCRRVGSPKAFKASYQPVSEVYQANPGSLDYWLSERYCLYTEHKSHLFRGEILHDPWPLQQAEAEISKNTMVDFDGATQSQPELVHYVKQQTAVMWGLKQV